MERLLIITYYKHKSFCRDVFKKQILQNGALDETRGMHLSSTTYISGVYIRFDFMNIALFHQ